MGRTALSETITLMYLHVLFVNKCTVYVLLLTINNNVGFTCYNKVGWDHKGKQRETRDQQKGHSGSNEGPKAGTQ